MPKLTRQELDKIRAREEEKLKKRDIHGKTTHVVVGMGTQGISAGAKNVLNALSDEIEKAGLENVILTQTGLIVSDKAPVVEVFSPEKGLVVYGNVSVKDAQRIVKEHLLENKILEDKRIQVEE